MKPHYPILDGLRGVAAVLVVIFHVLEVHFPNYAQHPIHHGYLAVDFFFLLSGFVVGYAYDDRWGRMTPWEFLKIRVVRLHPLILLSVLLGGLCFWLDPYAPAGAQGISALKLLGVMLITFTLLPAPDVRGWDETHALNGPLWSLLQEYVANILYAVVGRRLPQRGLWLLVVLSGVALAWVAIDQGNIATGWAHKTLWIAPIRMLYPFFAGLLLFRAGRLVRLPYAFPLCSLALAVLFCLPYFPLNGLYEAACIVLAFPLIVAAGAGGQVSGTWARGCKFLGAISYPIYVTHYPFINLYTDWVIQKKPTPGQALPVALGLFGFILLLAYASLKLYDEPVRAWLKRKVLGKAPQPVLSSK
ncbi:Peptidoglycan/LPS O-acetylase OafA/YrhL, contains acyltransferase and SGNH-hydrolase domains [Hymenobacter gelipurpurascens]|uniref:Peptidoglycan/LPS O-acetylase OafA/YrhL, contains acyltransferase and SGNH-hydrolase domains n=1 Tax=Hymenobacter gelipurpurascens TaxID=89968 RepID=A0A212UCJ6_9BACT|nr:acyltransferase [Hymenobacter gelipurpurascens]SNC75959.1 Peptidoglycan/LPS O-acetylase OafA/YrhL, contains acyltransferase and SGNH-hydrolase domains [Hymenobacter gelipurpurascens]